ncbi:MAG: fumarylacetoacetate hydrolase family protein [Actinomycetota bacterium]|nr:fumarylacetoacetate hydrolase family protein [Actinomycetota bacterium]
MRLLRFRQGEHTAFGVCIDDSVRVVSWDPFDKFFGTEEEIPLGDVDILPPVIPTKIVGVGLNYKDHAEELKMEPPPEPVLFLKAPSTLIGSRGNVFFPPQTDRLEYEAELAVVISKEAKDVLRGKAREYVLGYTCALDMTARDLQSTDIQWTRSKSFDTFCPIGPWVETELDPGDLSIELRLNGEVKQSSRTSEMLTPIDELVSYISSVMTLFPGDVILTGTPAGVGQVSPGDHLEVEIEGIGTLEADIVPSGAYNIAF